MTKVDIEKEGMIYINSPEGKLTMFWDEKKKAIKVMCDTIKGEMVVKPEAGNSFLIKINPI